MLSPQEFATIFYAQDVIKGACMSRFGYDYEVPDYASAVQEMQASEAASDSSLFGITDRSSAAEYGYGESPADTAESSNPPAEQSPAYIFVFTGQKGDKAALVTADAKSPGTIDGVQIPPGGCFGEGRKAIQGTYSSYWSDLGRQTWIRASLDAQTDPEYQDVIREWVGCMSKAGYRVTDPLNDHGDIDAALKTPGVDQAETEMALTDIDCKQNVKLIDRLNKVIADYSEKAIEDNQLALQEARDDFDAMLRRAADVIENGAPAQ